MNQGQRMSLCSTRLYAASRAAKPRARKAAASPRDPRRAAGLGSQGGNRAWLCHDTQTPLARTYHD